MEETTPNVTPPPPVPSQPINTIPTNSTFSAPPASRSKLPIIIITAIILLLIVLGLMYYFFFMKNTPPTSPTTQNTIPQTVPATPTPTIYDTTDNGLNSDADDMEINLSALDDTAASVDSGLSEPTPNL